MPVFSPFFNLFRWSGKSVADYAPWYRQATDADGRPWDGVVRLKQERGLLRSYTIRGMDWSGQGKETQGMRMMSANEALRRLEGPWTMHTEAQRTPVRRLPPLDSPYAIPRLLHANRCDQMLSGTGTRTTDYCISLVWLPEAVREDVREFVLAADECLAHLRGILAEARPLTTPEQLTYLKTTISAYWHPVAVPELDTDLDLYLCDSDWDSGRWREWDATLEDWHVRVCSLTGYPAQSWAGMMRALESLPVDYRWVTRWNGIEKHLQDGMLQHKQHNWLGQEINIGQRFWSASIGAETRITNEAMVRNTEDLSVVRQEMAYEITALGDFATTLVTWGNSAEEADTKLRRILHTLRGLGFIATQDGKPKHWFPQHVPAWLATHPGNTLPVLRTRTQTTLNAVHLMPGLQALWPGPTRNAHLNGPPWLTVQTEQHSLFRIGGHVRQVAHHLAVGPTGGGKSTLLWFLAMMWTQYPSAQISAWDNGKAGRLPTLLLGGHWYHLGQEPMGVQPLRELDTPVDRGLAMEWLLSRVEEGGQVTSAEVKNYLARGLEPMIRLPKRERRISTLLHLLTARSNRVETTARASKTGADGIARRDDWLTQEVRTQLRVREALEPFALGAERGEYGHIFDADHEDLQDGPVHTFELQHILGLKRLAKPLLEHLHLRSMQRFSTSAPTYMPMDEAAILLLMPANEAAWELRLMDARKREVTLGFFIHHPEQIFTNPLGPLLVNSCPTHYFFPNPAAKAPYMQQTYAKMGLGEDELRTIATAVPNKDIYYSCEELGKRLFHLSLSRFALDMLARNSDEDHFQMDRLLQEEGREMFPAAWMRHCGYEQEARYVEEHRQNRQSHSTTGVVEHGV